jgi:glycogen(starch) synthase
MRILLAADVFPPKCGGAGWSSYHLARALARRGHEVLVVVPRERQPGIVQRTYGGIPIRDYGYRSTRLPFLRNVLRNEVLWPRLGRYLAELVRAGRFDLIHAQHSQTIPAAVLAGRAAGVPVVGTVRDYWPLCYRSTLLGANDEPCGQCGTKALMRCLGGGLRTPLVALAAPYMRANVRRKARLLGQADAVVAVSRFVAGRLADLVPAERLHVLPNLVDLEEVDAVIAGEPDVPFPGPFLLFVGKVEANKGAADLAGALQRAAGQIPPEGRLPLLVAGDGSRVAWLEAELAGAGWPTHFLRWADHDEVLRLLARTTLLLFPSCWDEPLSRVLLEACACGTPILAMATGGTGEILEDGTSGAVVPPEEEAFAGRLIALLDDEAGRRHQGTGARRTAEERFAAPVVAGQVEALYQKLKIRHPVRVARIK